ncbi:hypothetical protein D6D06_06121 [Aureobasidium pullulans]|nr:hypothetical protein D6D06_06121 [Aureobasidium pullulans]
MAYASHRHRGSLGDSEVGKSSCLPLSLNEALGAVYLLDRLLSSQTSSFRQHGVPVLPVLTCEPKQVQHDIPYPLQAHRYKAVRLEPLETHVKFNHGRQSLEPHEKQRNDVIYSRAKQEANNCAWVEDSSAASDPAPTQPVPMQFAPMQFAPMQFAPMQPTPMQPAPIQPGSPGPAQGAAPLPPA